MLKAALSPSLGANLGSWCLGDHLLVVDHGIFFALGGAGPVPDHRHGSLQCRPSRYRKGCLAPSSPVTAGPPLGLFPSWLPSLSMSAMARLGTVGKIR